MGEDGIEIFFIGGVVSVLILSVGFTFFTMFLFHYKRRMLQQRQEKEIAYIKALATAEQEIKEETLNSIGRELHDNIGQILTVAKIQLHEVQEQHPHEGLAQVEETLIKAVDELRGLSRSLNSDRVRDVGLLKVLTSEMERIDSLTRMNAFITCNGVPYRFSGEKEIILYRILQEFISNSLKHSSGDELDLHLDFAQEGLHVRIKDNGHGFDYGHDKAGKGNGLHNMKSRANMIEASFHFQSAEEEGTRLEIFIKKETTYV